MRWSDALKALSVVADATSLVGFFLTIAVYVGLRRIRGFYIFRARIPELADRLTEKASTLSTLLADYANTQQQIEVEVAEITVLARSIGDKSTGESKAQAKKIIKTVQQKKHSGASGVWDVYVQVQTLLVVLREIQLDLKWEK